MQVFSRLYLSGMITSFIIHIPPPFHCARSLRAKTQSGHFQAVEECRKGADSWLFQRALWNGGTRRIAASSGRRRPGIRRVSGRVTPLPVVGASCTLSAVFWASILSRKRPGAGLDWIGGLGRTRCFPGGSCLSQVSNQKGDMTAFQACYQRITRDSHNIDYGTRTVIT